MYLAFSFDASRPMCTSAGLWVDSAASSMLCDRHIINTHTTHKHTHTHTQHTNIYTHTCTESEELSEGPSSDLVTDEDGEPCFTPPTALVRRDLSILSGAP